MHRILPLLAAVLVLPSAFAAPATDSLIGRHALEMGSSGNAVRLVLDCTSETQCTFTTTSSQGTDVQTLKTVRPVQTLTPATTALKFAADHQTQTLRNRDNVEAMRQLRPLLANNSSISKCWDLNYPEPEYMLACTLASTPSETSPLLLFTTLLTNCNDGFCRYLITPTSPAK